MDVSISNLTAGSNSTNGSSQATASITPAANDLILLAVSSRTDISTDANEPTASGNGLTWEAIGSILFDTTSTSRKRVTLFRAMGASPSTGAITIDFGGQTQTDVSWCVDQASGIDTSGTNGSGAIVQSATNKDETGVNSLTVTLSAFSSVNNATYGAFGYEGNNTPTAGSGFSLLGQNNDDLLIGTTTEYKSTNDTTVDMSYSGTNSLGGIAVELKAADTGTAQSSQALMMGFNF